MVLISKWRPGKEEVVAENGVVTSMLPQSAEAGLHILKSGGNAVDRLPLRETARPLHTPAR